MPDIEVRVAVVLQGEDEHAHGQAAGRVVARQEGRDLPAYNPDTKLNKVELCRHITSV